MDTWRERLALEIHARGFKLTKLSTSLGFHRDYISNVLSGKAKPSTDKLEQICSEIGVPFATILLGTSDDDATAASGTEVLNNPALESVQHMILDGNYNKSDGKD